MKPNALASAALLLVLSVSCASGDGFIDSTNNDCESGSGIEIDAGFDPASTPRPGFDGRINFLVEVANLSDDEITVERIRVEPQQSETAAYQLQSATRDFSETVAEAADELFEIPMNLVSRTPARWDESNRRQQVSVADVNVTVFLAGGASHRCRFRVAMPF
jgi:hypothetical protein